MLGETKFNRLLSHRTPWSENVLHCPYLTVESFFFVAHLMQFPKAHIFPGTQLGKLISLQTDSSVSATRLSDLSDAMILTWGEELDGASSFGAHSRNRERQGEGRSLLPVKQWLRCHGSQLVNPQAPFFALPTKPHSCLPPWIHRNPKGKDKGALS